MFLQLMCDLVGWLPELGESEWKGRRIWRAKVDSHCGRSDFGGSEGRWVDSIKAE